MSEEYIKKEDALKAICKFCPRGDNGLGLSPCLFPEYCISDELNELNGLPTHSISEMAAPGEYIRKADMEKILYSTNNAVRIGELFTELPTYSFPDREKGEWKKIWRDDCGFSEYVCSKCDCGEDYVTDFCPNCGADMRGKEE